MVPQCSFYLHFSSEWWCWQSFHLLICHACTFLDSKETADNVGDHGLIPGLGRSPGGGQGNPLQYSCLQNSMDGGPWWVPAHGVEKTQTRTEWLTLSLSYLLWLCGFFLLFLLNWVTLFFILMLAVCFTHISKVCHFIFLIEQKILFDECNWVFFFCGLCSWCLKNLSNLCFFLEVCSFHLYI